MKSSQPKRHKHRKQQQVQAVETVAGEDLEMLVEEQWQQFWAERGEQLVWQAWAIKYPDYVRDDMVHLMPVGGSEEVLVEDIAAHDANSSSSITGNNVMDSTCQSAELSVNSNQTECTTENEKSKGIGFYHLSESKTVAASVVLYKLKEDGSQGRSDVSSNVHSSVLDDMHAYSCKLPVNDVNSIDLICRKNGDSDVEGPSRDVEGENVDYSAEWRALWDDHCVEVFWYYYTAFTEGRLDVNDDISILKFALEGSVTALDADCSEQEKADNDNITDDDYEKILAGLTGDLDIAAVCSTAAYQHDNYETPHDADNHCSKRQGRTQSSKCKHLN